MKNTSFWRALQAVMLWMLMAWFSSCKSSAPVAYVPLPVENAIHECMVRDDMKGLIRQYLDYPEYRERLADYLFFSCHYEDDSYGTLLLYCDWSAADSILSKGFQDILYQREARILTELSERSLAEVALYYQQHEVERRFLRPALHRTLLANLEEYDYQSLRTIRKTFLQTDLLDAIDRVYLPAKQVVQRELDQNLKPYFQEEWKVLRQCREACHDELKQFMAAEVQEVLEDLLDDDLPEGEEAVNRFYSEVLSRHINQYELGAILQKYFVLCQDNLNDGRAYYLASLMEGESYAGYELECYVPDVYLDLYHSLEPLYKLSEIQNKTDWVGWGLSAASLVANLLSFGTAGTLIDVYDVKRTMDNSNEEAAVMKELVSQFSTDLHRELELYSNRCIEQYFKEFQARVKASQQSFKSVIYENY